MNLNLNYVKRKQKENKKEFSKYMVKLGANSRMEKGNRMNLKHPTAKQCREKFSFSEAVHK